MDDLMLKDLEQYEGTTKYYDYSSVGIIGKVKLTEGVAYIIRNGYSWFVNDAVSVILCELKSRAEGLLCVKLILCPCCRESAQMIITDGADTIFHTKDYDVTAAKRDLVLYYSNGVLSLSGED